MNPCPHLKQFLNDQTAEPTPALRAHANECNQCRQVLGFETQLGELFSREAEGVPYPNERQFTRKVMDRIVHLPAPAGSSGNPLPWFVPVVAIGVLAVLPLIFRSSTKAPAPQGVTVKGAPTLEFRLPPGQSISDESGPLPPLSTERVLAENKIFSKPTGAPMILATSRGDSFQFEKGPARFKILNGRLEFFKGSLWIEAAKRGPKEPPLVFSLPLGRAEIVGTVLRIQGEGQPTEVGVNEGRVHLFSKSDPDQPFAIGAGFYRILDQKGVSAPKKFNGKSPFATPQHSIQQSEF